MKTRKRPRPLLSICVFFAAGATTLYAIVWGFDVPVAGEPAKPAAHGGGGNPAAPAKKLAEAGAATLEAGEVRLPTGNPRCTLHATPGWFGGKFISETKGVASAGACAELCAAHEDFDPCEFFTFREPDRACHLFSTREQPFNPDASHQTGRCTAKQADPAAGTGDVAAAGARLLDAEPFKTYAGYPPGCTVLRGKTFASPGRPAAQSKQATAGLCAFACAEADGCAAFRFQYWDSLCLLYTAKPSDLRDDRLQDAGVDCVPADPSKPDDPWKGFSRVKAARKQFDAEWGGSPRARPKAGLAPVTESYLCPPAVSDHAAWRERLKTLNFNWAPAAQFNPPIPEALGPTWYCDKLYNDLSPYRPLSGLYSHQDLVVGLYSGESLLYSRAAICEDTWLQELPHKYIYTAANESRSFGVPENTLSVVPLWHAHDSLRPRNERTNAQLLQLHGLADMYRRHPEAHWFLIVGDDTYVNSDEMLKGLEEYDSEEMLWLAPYGYRETRGKSDAWKWLDKVISVDKLEGYYPKFWRERHNLEFEWTSGGSSWILSRPAAQLYAENIDAFLKRVPANRVCYCPDVITGLLLSMLGLRITQINHMQFNANAVDSKLIDFSSPRHDKVPLYHYVQPGRMIALDERLQHAKLDRLINLDDAASLLSFGRAFAGRHEAAKRRRLLQLQQLQDVAGGAREPLRLAEPAEYPEVLKPLEGDLAGYVAQLRQLLAAHFASLRAWQQQILKAATATKKYRVAAYDIPQ
ncbi:hypothetical protein DIPPA_26088 [Diplonema papillatum]|nr:hypothetical protein DIPPA_26088 [Diplonema papillatum]